MAMRHNLFAILCGCALAAPVPLAAKGLSSQGQIALEGRSFWPDGKGATEDNGLAIAPRLELKYRHKPFRANLRVFGRVDALDGTRAVAMIEEALHAEEETFVILETLETKSSSNQSVD